MDLRARNKAKLEKEAKAEEELREGNLNNEGEIRKKADSRERSIGTNDRSLERPLLMIEKGLTYKKRVNEKK